MRNLGRIASKYTLVTLALIALFARDGRAQTYTLSPIAKQSFTDSNGDPIAGGKLCTYLSGTTTAASTYSDTAGTLNTNPIILSAAGRPTNGGVEVGIYLAAGSSYKFVLLTAGTDSTCATGTTVWSQDGIGAVPASGSSVDISSAVAGESLTLNQCVYLSDGSGAKTAGRWYRCDAATTYSSTLPEVGIGLATVTTGQTLSVRTAGSVTGLSGLSVGAEYYVSGTVGGLTSTAPANRRHLGHADTTTSLVLTGNPTSSTWSVVTTTSTGTQNDFAPGLVGNTIIRCNNATLLTITGLAAGYDGQHVTFESIGAGQVDLSPQAAGSSAANRLINFATIGTTSLAAGSGTAEYVYDATTARWRLTQHDQGAWITGATPTITGNGSMTISGVSASLAPRWRLSGRTLTWTFDVAFTTGGVANTQVLVALPNGFTGAGQGFGVYNKTLGTIALDQPGATTVLILFADLSATANWTLAAHRAMATVVQDVQ